MSLRTTILLIVAMVLVGLVVLLVINLQTILSSHFARQEQQNVSLVMQRTQGILDLETESLNLIAKEWASRKDVVDFFQSNGTTSFPALPSTDCNWNNQLSVGFLVDPEERIIETVNCRGASLKGLNKTFSTKLVAPSGLLQLPQGPFLISTAPVSATGAMVVTGRILDETELERINLRFSTQIALLPLDASQLTPEVQAAIVQLSQNNTSAYAPIDENNIAGYTILNDVYGKHAYILQVVQPRTIYYSGQLVTNYLMIFLIVSSFIFGLVITILLERLVLSRLSQLSLEVSQIGHDGDFSSRVTLSHHDELTRLGKNINAMLSDLNERMHELETLYAASQEFLGTLDTDSILKNVCKLAMEKMDLNLAWIGQIHYESGKLIPIASEGSVLAHIPIYQVDCSKRDQPIACQALCREEPIFEDASDYDDLKGSEAAIPMQIGGETTAVLVLSSPTPDYFMASRQSLILAFANQAGLALQSARFFDEAKITQHRLELLSHRLVQVQEEERRIIAQELHDEIGQMLTGLKLQIETGISNPEKLKEARNLVNELIGQVRQMSFDLRPAMLDDLGLLPALAWLINRYTPQTGIKVEFVHSGLEDRRFPSEIEITAYRVVQEALTNIARYAQVKTASLHVWANPSDLMVQVSDHGVGFDFKSTILKNEGRGLLGMRERVNFVGGTLFIESEPNQGTTIIAKLAIPPNRED